MTAIAFDGRYIAIDRILVGGNLYDTTTSKLIILEGAIYAIAGPVSHVQAKANFCELAYKHPNVDIDDIPFDRTAPLVRLGSNWDEERDGVPDEATNVLFRFDRVSLKTLTVNIKMRENGIVKVSFDDDVLKNAVGYLPNLTRTFMILGMDAVSAIRAMCNCCIMVKGPIDVIDTITGLVAYGVDARYVKGEFSWDAESAIWETPIVKEVQI